jgi:succinoglycan biosynthesis transport protein ExoP
MPMSHNSFDKYPPSNGQNNALIRPQYIDVPRASEKQSPNPLLEYWGIIRRRKLLIALLSIAGLLGGLAAYVLGTPVYQAMTTLEVQGFNENFMNMSSVDPQAGTGSYSATQLNIATQIKIIESAQLKGLVLDRLERETTPVMATPSGFTASLRNRLRLGPQDPLDSMKQGLQMAASTVTAKPVVGTRVISISCETTTPDIAANFANALAAEYQAQNVQFRSNTGQKTAQWLESQLEETKTKLEQAEARLQQFVRKSGGIFVADQDTLANSKVRQLQTDLAAIQADLITKRTRFEMAKSVPLDSIPDVLDAANLQEYQSKITSLTSERASLMTTLTAEHPKVKKVDVQIQEMERARDRERANVLERIRNEYEVAARRQKQLASAYSGQSQTVLSQADQSAEYGLLKREVETYRTSLNALLQQTNQAGVASVVPTSNVRVIDMARPPGAPSKPEPISRAGYGLTLGFGLGCAIAVIHARIRKSVKDQKFAGPGHTSTLLNVPELGVIPSASFGVLTPVRRFGWGKKKSESDPTELTSDELSAWGYTSSPLADSFRLVLTSIMTTDTYAKPGSRRYRLGAVRQAYAQVMVVTSPGPGEGKTMVISNLAVAIAETGGKVLVVDTDLRRPRIHRVFNVENDRGLSNLIQESGAISHYDVIQPTRFPGISVLSSGSSKTNISQAFYSPRIQDLLLNLRNEFDTILIDTPPMLQFPEARLMGRLADGVILVLRASLTHQETALLARQRLHDDNIPLLGTILNDWDPREGSSDHFYSSYYQYYVNNPAEKS